MKTLVPVFLKATSATTKASLKDIGFNLKVFPKAVVVDSFQHLSETR
jgi:hypothetical protein